MDSLYLEDVNVICLETGLAPLAFSILRSGKKSDGAVNNSDATSASSFSCGSGHDVCVLMHVRGTFTPRAKSVLIHYGSDCYQK